MGPQGFKQQILVLQVMRGETEAEKLRWEELPNSVISSFSLWRV